MKTNGLDYTSAKWKYYAKAYRCGLLKSCEPGYTNEKWRNLSATHTNAAYYCCTADSHTKNCSGCGCNPGYCIAAGDSDRNANERLIEPEQKALPAHWSLSMGKTGKNAVPLTPPPNFLKKPDGSLPHQTLIAKPIESIRMKPHCLDEQSY